MMGSTAEGANKRFEIEAFKCFQICLFVGLILATLFSAVSIYLFERFNVDGFDLTVPSLTELFSALAISFIILMLPVAIYALAMGRYVYLNGFPRLWSIVIIADAPFALVLGPSWIWSHWDDYVSFGWSFYFQRTILFSSIAVGSVSVVAALCWWLMKKKIFVSADE
jgi:hypothetical protein